MFGHLEMQLKNRKCQSECDSTNIAPIVIPKINSQILHSKATLKLKIK